MHAKPVVRQATASDAPAVQAIMNAIPWIAESAKTEEGFERTKSACGRGEVWVVEDNSVIVSTMTLTKDPLAAFCGYKIWLIRLIATIEAARRKGHARRLIHKAKEIVDDGALTAHVQNDDSSELVSSEGFVLVEGHADAAGYPLYEWTRNAS